MEPIYKEMVGKTPKETDTAKLLKRGKENMRSARIWFILWSIMLILGSYQTLDDARILRSGGATDNEIVLIVVGLIVMATALNRMFHHASNYGKDQRAVSLIERVSK